MKTKNLASIKYLPAVGYRHALQWIVQRPKRILVLFAALTLLFGWQLPRLSFQSSVYDLIVENIPEAEYYNRFKGEFGSEEIVLISITSDTLFAPRTFHRIEEMARQVARIEGVVRADSLPGIKRLIDVGHPKQLDEFERIIASVDLFWKNFLSADKRSTVIVAVVEDVKNKRPIIDAIEDILTGFEEELSLYQIGMPLVERALAAYTFKDLVRLPPVTFLVIMVILYLLFRRIRYVLLPAGSILTALVWTFGLMAWTRTSLSLLTVIVPVFLIAVGTAYCMHIIADYQTAAAAAGTVRQAVTACFGRMGLPTALAVATTVVGLASLTASRVKGVREFALFSCFGMLGLLAVVLVLLPAVLALLPPPAPRPNPSAPPRSLWDRLLGGIVAVNLRHQKPALTILAIVTCIAGIGIAFLKVETNPVDYFKQGTPIRRHFHQIHQDLAGSFPVNLVLDSKTFGYFENPAHVNQILQIQQFLDSLDGVDKTISFADFLKLVNTASNDYRRDQYRIPTEAFEVRMLINTYKSLLGQDMFARFMNLDGSKTNILLRTHLASSLDFLRLKRQIREYLDAHHPDDFDVHVTGLGMVIAQSSTIFTAGQLKSLFLTLSIIFTIMLLLFLSGKVGLAAILPNCFPIIVNFGFMGWCGIKFSVATSLVATIAVGLAVDDTIHYLVRYNREFKKDLDKDRALRDTIRQVGRPIVFTSITIAAGFAVLIFSHFEPTAIYGILMMMTMAAALIGDLILLPAVMLHVELVTAWDLLRLLPSLGGLSGGLTHELNQPLNAIKMGSEFLKMMMQRGGRLERGDLIQVVSEIDGQVDRAAGIIKRLSEFGPETSFEKQPTDVHEAIRNTAAVVSSQLKLDNIRLELDLASHLPAIWAHPHRIAQVIYSLVINGAEAIGRKAGENPDRTITIRTAHAAGQVTVSVADTGGGIPEHIKERLFEPFFTTKEAGRGKGLGLSISRQIVRDCGGAIAVKRPGSGGTVFTITLPAGEPAGSA